MNFQHHCYANPNLLNQLVSDEVKRQLRPNFFELFFQEIRFQNAVDEAVQKRVPVALNYALSSNSGIVANFVQQQLPSVLSQQQYFLDGLKTQQKQFEETIRKNQQIYTDKQSQHMKELQQKSDELIRNKIADVASNQYVLKQMEQQLERRMQTQLQSFAEKANRSAKQDVFTTGLLGACAGSAITCLLFMFNK